MNISPVAISAAFVLGLCVGSFLNVCIWRIPADEQVVRGRSHCRACGKTIAWHDNVPLVSFLILGGRCRHCRGRIAWSYPLVELAAGVLLAGSLLQFGWSGAALVYAILGAALIVLSVIDWRTMLLPDEITLPGIGAGLAASFLVPELHGTLHRWPALILSVLGAAAGAGTTWGIQRIGTWVFKQEAMGDGDVKLMAMVGSILGVWKTLAVVFFFGPILGSALGLALIWKHGFAQVRARPIPYGPFLALGTMAVVWRGEEILAWYRGLLF